VGDERHGEKTGKHEQKRQNPDGEFHFSFLRCAEPPHGFDDSTEVRRTARIRRNPAGRSAISRSERKGGHEMKRVMILALMLFAVLIPLTGIAQADLKSDEAIEQAP
jgi:hypothetical protein